MQTKRYELRHKRKLLCDSLTQSKKTTQMAISIDNSYSNDLNNENSGKVEEKLTNSISSKSIDSDKFKQVNKPN